jgi:hypothetical protein
VGNLHKGDTSLHWDVALDSNDGLEATYSPSFMEEEGNYYAFLNGLSFNYLDLENELTPSDF